MTWPLDMFSHLVTWFSGSERPENNHELERIIDRLEQLRVAPHPASKERMIRVHAGGMEIQGSESDFEISLRRVVETAEFGDLAQVLWASCPARSSMDRHDHDTREILIVKSGRMEISRSGKRSVSLGPGEHCYLAPKQLHAVYFPEETEVLAILVPRAVEYDGAP